MNDVLTLIVFPLIFQTMWKRPIANNKHLLEAMTKHCQAIKML